MKKLPKNSTEFLRESNLIEGVESEQCLALAEEAFTYALSQNELMLSSVLETHRILMNSDDAWSEPHLRDFYSGKLRDCDVYVGSRKCPDPSLVRNLLLHWIHRLKSQANLDPMKMHVLYEKIHPFVDGNGRTGRIFLNWTRVKQGLPILVIKNSEKKEYYKLFKDV